MLCQFVSVNTGSFCSNTHTSYSTICAAHKKRIAKSSVHLKIDSSLELREHGTLLLKLNHRITTSKYTDILMILYISFIHRFHHFPLSDERLLICFCAFAIGGPLLFLLVALTAHHVPSTSIIQPNFGVSSCWFGSKLITKCYGCSISNSPYITKIK
jgi:hypothetical protein